MAFIENRKAHFHFELLEKFEAGLELVGHEVKSLRNGQGSLDGAHIIVRGGEAYVVGMHIPAFQEKNTKPDYDSRRTRRLLLTKREISALAEAESKKGLTIVPLSVYNKNSKLKLALSIARGKRASDKRETIKRREADREAQRALHGGA